MNWVLIAVLAGILVTILLSAFFSGVEMALSSANRVRLENEAEDGVKKAKRTLKLLDKFDWTLSTILVGNNLVNIAASSLTTVLVIMLTGSDKFNWLGTLILTVLILLFGESLPKIACKKQATRISKKSSGLIAFFRILFWPVSAPVSAIVGLITKPIKAADEDENEDESTAELQQIIDTAENEGVLDSDQSEIVSAAIDFSEISADAVMTARVDMEAFDLNSDRTELIAEIIKSTHSRIPFYEGSVDHIVGVAHLNHILKALSEDRNADIRPLLMEPLYVYRTTKLPQVLNLLKKARQHLAIVVDEYSGTLGVVTMEDVLEEIVGDIWDETDEIEEEVVEHSDGTYEVDGDMRIEDLEELLEEPEDAFDCESDTVGGLVIEKNGDFPKEGDVVELAENITATVMEMEGLRVLKLLVKKRDDVSDM